MLPAEIKYFIVIIIIIIHTDKIPLCKRWQLANDQGCVNSLYGPLYKESSEFYFGFGRDCSTGFDLC